MNKPPIPRESIPIRPIETDARVAIAKLDARLRTIETELAKLKDREAASAKKLDAELGEFRRKQDTFDGQLGELHEQYGQIMAATASLDGEVRAQRTQLTDISLKLDRLISLAGIMQSKTFWDSLKQLAKIAAISVATGLATYFATRGK